jgi:hypothetical protein
MSGFGGTSSGGGGGGTITGSGTVNRVSKFTGATAIGDSNIEDNGSNIIVRAGAAGSPILISRGAVGQTGDSFQIQDSVGNVLSAFLAGGELCVFTQTLVGAEKLRVFGDSHFDGQIRVTNSVYLIDFYVGQNTFFESDDGQNAAVSGANTGRIRYNNLTGTWQISTQGSVYADIGTATIGPGTTNNIAKFTGATTIGDSNITDDGNTITLNASNAAQVVGIVIGAGAQVADLLQFQSSTTAVLSAFLANGELVINNTALSGSEKLRVTGDALIEGKLTVTGVVDPTALILTDPPATQDLYIESFDGQNAGLSAANSGRLRYNNVTGTWQQSVQGGAYTDISGGGNTLTLALSTKTANYTIVDADFTILADAPAATPITITLPTAVGRTGKVFVIKKINLLGADTVTVDAAGAETIDGLASFVLIAQYESIMVQSDGANWVVI